MVLIDKWFIFGTLPLQDQTDFVRQGLKQESDFQSIVVSQNVFTQLSVNIVITGFKRCIFLPFFVFFCDFRIKSNHISFHGTAIHVMFG